MGPAEEILEVFRPKYRKLSEAEERELSNIKSIASDLYRAIELNTTNFGGVTTPNKAVDNAPSIAPKESNGREMALAKTKLEEAVMWAVKGLTK